MISTNLLFLLVCLTLSKKAPNILFILGDDIGYDDIGFQSHTIKTPNLDRLKSTGQFIPHYYAQCVCSPTRGALLTGLYPLHNGINTVLVPHDTYGLSLNWTILPQALKNNGYDTHMVGKWHLGYYKWEYTPTFRGFNSWLGYYTGVEDYYTHINGYYDMHEDNSPNCGVNCSIVPTELYGVYSTYIFVNRTIEIIKNHATNPDTKDMPLFLYLAFQTGHYPDASPQKYIDMNSDINDTQRRLYAGMLTCMDEGIGNITDALEKYGYLDNSNGNTIIIFSSDNGAPVPEGNVTQDGSNAGYNWPLRGGKDTIWEGGTRVTSLIWGTEDVIPKHLQGTNYTQLMHIIDWYPTLLSSAGIDIQSLNLNYTLDGINHWKGITGNYTNTTNYDPYFQYRSNLYYGYEVSPLFKYIGYRNKWYKLLNTSGGGPQGWFPPPEMSDKSGSMSYIKGSISNGSYPLFNLESDPTEHHDLQKENEEMVDVLLYEMVSLFDTGIPQSVGETDCPNQTEPVYPVVGKVWMPWCS